ncbi:MAG: glucose 1-dehydrogenase [Bacteroidota bacterium]
MFDLSGKVALVTGGASGIGEAICKAYYQQGAIVYVLDINQEEGEQLVSKVDPSKERLKFRLCDVTQSSETQALFQRIYEVENQLDILVNNAGIAHIGTVESTSEEDFERITQVNVNGVFYCIKAAIPWMKKQGGGCIINMASVVAMVGLQDRFAYTTSKGAVLAMTYEVAKDYLAENIRCNSISPARIHTPFIDGYLAKTYPGKEEEMFQILSKTQPIGRMGTPKEVAALAVYLASDEAAFITGSNFPIDGGFVTLNT